MEVEARHVCGYLRMMSWLDYDAWNCEVSQFHDGSGQISCRTKKKNANPRNKDLKSLKLSSFYLTYTSTLQVIEHPFLERWYVTDTDRSILLCYLWSCPFNCML